MSADDPNSDSGAPLADAANGLEPGTRVGRFVVVGTAGRGGMGVVYRAYDPELDRKVALKLLQVGSTDSTTASQGRLRLQREAQAMARLSHPNVVTVHDVGVHREQIFLAMELVEGHTLREWLAERPRTWKEAVRVFRQAGEGLAAAHAAGIVHRDFKPTNVLIGKDERVRVMDFGVARAVTAEVGAAFEPSLAHAAVESGQRPVSVDTPLTRVGAMVGTPGYMSPEQYQGRRVDAKSDQYGFCVALYEALYGERPFQGETIDELSANVLGGRVEAAPKERTVPAWVRRVVLRGLAVDPAQRYADMKALLTALEQDPAAKRKTWALAATSLFVVAALGFGGKEWMRRQSLLCKGAEKKLAGVWDAEKKRAVEEAFKATGKSYAADTWIRVEKLLDGYTAGWVAMHAESCEATQVRGEQSAALLDLRMGCLDNRLKHVRALVNVFSRADATVAQEAVQAAHSLPPLSRCADKEALTAAVPPPEDNATQKKVEELRDKLIEAKALEDAGKYVTGLQLAAVGVEEAKHLGYEPIEAETLYRLGSLQEKSGRYEAAEQSLRNAWVAGEAANYAQVEAEATTALISVVGYRRGRPQEGEELGRHAGAIRKRLRGDQDLEASWLNNMGNVVWFKGEYDQAQEYYTRSLAVRQSAWGPEHPIVAMSLNNLGGVFYNKGEYDQAREYYGRALAIWQKTLGPRHPNVAIGLNNLGNIFAGKGEYDKAEKYHMRALAIRETALGSEHPFVAWSLDNLGEVFRNKGERDKAREYLERALAIRERVLGSEHPDVAWSLNRLGAVFQDAGDDDQAQAYFERSLAIWEKALGPAHRNVALSLNNLGEVFRIKGQPSKAQRYCERALSICSSQSCEPDVVPAAAFSVAKALAMLGREQGRAVDLAEQARRAYAKLPAKKKELAEVDAWLAKYRR